MIGDRPAARARALLTLLAMTLLAAAIAAGCRKIAPRAELEHLRIGFLADPLATLLYLADATGAFARNGLEVSFRHYDGGTYAIESMAAGAIDLAVATEYALVHQSFRHRDLRSFATIATARNAELLVRRDRGIERPSDLRGRRVGVSAGMNIHYILGTFLAFNGLRLTDVAAVDLAPSDIIAELRKGTIDAGCIYPPFTGRAKSELGTNVLAWPVQDSQDYYFQLVARERLTREQPQVVAAMLRALLEAESYLRKHPAESRQVVARALYLSEDEVVDRWGGIGLRVALDEDLLTLMEDEARWIVSHGLADGGSLPNCYELLHFEPLERLKPAAVSVIH